MPPPRKRIPPFGFSALNRRQKSISVRISGRQAPGPLYLLVPSRRHGRLPGRGQHGDQVPGRWRRAVSRAWHPSQTPVPQGPFGDRHQHRRHPGGGIYLKPRGPLSWFVSKPLPRSGQPGFSGPADPNPAGSNDRHRNRRWRLRHTPVMQPSSSVAAPAIIPIRKNGRLWKEDCAAAMARNDILRAARRLGRPIWKRWSGGCVRRRVEANPLVTLPRNALPGNGCAVSNPLARGPHRETPTAKPPKSTSALHS